MNAVLRPMFVTFPSGPASGEMESTTQLIVPAPEALEDLGRLPRGGCRRHNPSGVPNNQVSIGRRSEPNNACTVRCSSLTSGFKATCNRGTPIEMTRASSSHRFPSRIYEMDIVR